MNNILIKKFKRNLADYGFLIAVKKMLLYPFADIYKKKDYLIYKKDLRKYKSVEKDNPAFTYKFFTKENLTENIKNQILEIEEWLIDRADFIFDHNGICLVALDSDKVAGFNLVSTDEVYMPLIEIQRKFKNDQAWSEQITVRKEYRSKGLGSILRYKMFDELKLRGFSSLYGGTMWDNWSNIELSKKVGFIIFLKVKFKRIFKNKTYRDLSNQFERIYPGNKSD